MKKRILSMLLVIIMLITTFPITSVASSDDLCVGDVIYLINNATIYASQASYKVNKNGIFTQNPYIEESLSGLLEELIHQKDENASVNSYFAEMFDLGDKTANITNGQISDNENVVEKDFLKPTVLLETDVKLFLINGNTYTIELVDDNALTRVTNSFIKHEEIKQCVENLNYGPAHLTLEYEILDYKNIVITAQVDNGIITNFTITYDLDAIIGVVLMNQWHSRYDIYTHYQITYSDFNYDNVDLPETLNGWINENGKWAYYENNIKLKNRWLHDSAGWCYVGADGYCLTNSWVKDSYGWCYLNANGRMVCNNWVYDNGKWYFMDAKGYMVSNCWKKDSNGWCYLGSSGAMLTNAWVRDSVGWCYVGANGYCVTNKWVKDSKGWCYLDSNGRMVYNKWVKDSKGWCYVGSSGYMVYNQWVQTSGKWYYIDASGYMVTGTKVINGKTYKFNSSGVWIG